MLIIEVQESYCSDFDSPPVIIGLKNETRRYVILLGCSSPQAPY